MGSYIGAVIHNERVYVSSGDRYLYALEKYIGNPRWKYQFVSPGHYPATIAENVLYINTDGAYARSLANGAVLWHQHLGSSPSVSFTPSFVLDRVVYLASIDGHRQSILYALNASDGTEYWHNYYPHQIAPHRRSIVLFLLLRYQTVIREGSIAAISSCKQTPH